MIQKTKFYCELVKAKTDDVSLIKVIDKIMPIIESKSFDNYGNYDEDLKSFLISHCIEIVKTEGFAEKLLKN